MGANPYGVAIADINGDGVPDIIVTNSGEDDLSVLLNTTPVGSMTLSFAPQVKFMTGSFPTGVAVGDFNGDGKPDIAVSDSNYAASGVSVLLNTTPKGATTPSFSPQQEFNAGLGPFSVAVADINGDGKPDLALSIDGNSYNSPYGGRVSILLNTTPTGAATVSFTKEQEFISGFSPGDLAIADLNGDGKPDIVTANTGSDSVSVLENLTLKGSFTPALLFRQDYKTGNNVQTEGVAIGDFNGDGLPDIVAANLQGNNVSVFLSTPLVTIGKKSATGTIIQPPAANFIMSAATTDTVELANTRAIDLAFASSPGEINAWAERLTGIGSIVEVGSAVNFVVATRNQANLPENARHPPDLTTTRTSANRRILRRPVRILVSEDEPDAFLWRAMPFIPFTDTEPGNVR